MKTIELNEMDLNLVNGGEDGNELSEPFKKLMEFLDDYDVRHDPGVDVLQEIRNNDPFKDTRYFNPPQLVG